MRHEHGLLVTEGLYCSPGILALGGGCVRSGLPSGGKKEQGLLVGLSDAFGPDLTGRWNARAIGPGTIR